MDEVNGLVWGPCVIPFLVCKPDQISPATLSLLDLIFQVNDLQKLMAKTLFGVFKPKDFKLVRLSH